MADVARAAPAHVVDGAELVDVDEDAGEGLVVALGALELLVEPGVEEAEVVEPGQLVVHAEPLEPGLLEHDLLVEPLDAQHARDAGEELGLLEGLADVVVGADAQALDAARGVGLHRDEHHGEEGVERHALEQAARLDARRAAA